MSGAPDEPRHQLQAARAVQHRRHAEPAAGQRMREGVQQRLRLRAVAIVGHEELRRRAERDEGVAVLHRADADGGGRHVAGPPAQHDGAVDTPFRRAWNRRARPAGRAALDRGSASRPARGRSPPGSVRPVARGLVQPERARGIGHLRDRIAGQPQPQIILGRENFRDAAEGLRLVRLQPEQLRRGEAGHRDDAGDPREIRHGGEQFAAFARRAPVIPQDRRPDRRRRRDRPARRACIWPDMPKARTARNSAGLGGAETRDGLLQRGPPVLGVLLRPARPRGGRPERHRRFGKHRLRVVDEHGLQRRGSEIDAEIGHAKRSCCRR